MNHRTHFCCRVALAFALFFAAIWLSAPVTAKMIMPRIEKSTLADVIKNLEEYARSNPKDTHSRFNLGRAHAMAYALKSESKEIDVTRLATNKGVRPVASLIIGGKYDVYIPAEVKVTKDDDKLKQAKEHLNKAIENYDEALKLNPNTTPAIQLGKAWCVEQTGDKLKAIDEYRKAVKAGWERENNLDRIGLHSHPITPEAVDCLIPLLDAQKDRTEIDELRFRAERTRKIVSRDISPIVIPLRPDCTVHDLEDRAASVLFDADGSGPKRWTWITKDAGWLVYDPRHTGKITSGLQLFGNVTFWMFWDDGYQVLSALDNNRDEALSGDELAGLALWQDANGNGVSDPGEVKPLANWGIVSLSCRSVRDHRHTDRIAYSPQGVTFRDGTTRPTFDLILHQAEPPKR